LRDAERREVEDREQETDNGADAQREERRDSDDAENGEDGHGVRYRRQGERGDGGDGDEKPEETDAGHAAPFSGGSEEVPDRGVAPGLGDRGERLAGRPPRTRPETEVECETDERVETAEQVAEVF